MYRHAFEMRLTDVSELRYNSLGWTDAEASTLAAVLRSGAVPKLTTLNLQSNLIGDEGVLQIVDALHAGAPCLETLVLTKNRVSQSGLHALAATVRKGALPRCHGIIIKGVGTPEEKEIVQAAFRERAQAAGVTNGPRVEPHDLNLNDHYVHLRTGNERPGV